MPERGYARSMVFDDRRSSSGELRERNGARERERERERERPG
jgi:hypothetical protein